MAEIRQPPPTYNKNVDKKDESCEIEYGQSLAIMEQGVEGAAGLPNFCIPTEAQLVLLCLDHLRDLRRAYDPIDLQESEGLNADYVSLSIYALSRCFLRPEHVTHANGNDSMFGYTKNNVNTSYINDNVPNDPHRITANIPSIKVINAEILNSERNPYTFGEDGCDQKKEDDDPYLMYEYDDMHPSNSLRFYPLNGLAGGPSLRRPLALGEITAVGLAGMGARSRLDSEREMVQSPLFQQFVAAVTSKGFFTDIDNDTKCANPDEDRLRIIRKQKVYNDRYRKVVAKFRNKLATKAELVTANNTEIGCESSNDNNSTVPIHVSSEKLTDVNGDVQLLALAAADKQRRRWEKNVMDAKIMQTQSANPSTPPRSRTVQQHQQRSTELGISNSFVEVVDAEPSTPLSVYNFAMHNFQSPNRENNSTVAANDVTSPLSIISQNNPMDIEQAESLKSEGNSFMQKKEYLKAVASYTEALKLSPSGPNSHVYFSNRAAALLSIKRFSDAISDSERSLALRPDYGKAHARLGLAHFLMGNYRQAMEAYTVSLKYDPENKSSQSYLEKAAKRLAARGKDTGSDAGAQITSSFSLVSEWDKSVPANNHIYSGGSVSYKGGPLTTESILSPPRIKNTEESNNNKTSNNALNEKQKLINFRDAEKCKTKGNSYMASRDYKLALESYSNAIRLSPDGPHSHVYFSNRAAALCYLERYRDAENDSERSLHLNPTYGKAHARLGLSRFFLQKYEGAVQAYTAALKFDPDNAASKSYLAKAMSKLEYSTNNNNDSGTSLETTGNNQNSSGSNSSNHKRIINHNSSRSSPISSILSHKKGGSGIQNIKKDGKK